MNTVVVLRLPDCRNAPNYSCTNNGASQMGLASQDEAVQLEHLLRSLPGLCRATSFTSAHAHRAVAGVCGFMQQQPLQHLHTTRRKGSERVLLALPCLQNSPFPEGLALHFIAL